MYIAVSTPVGFRHKLRYNERKVEAGKAELIYAGNFILDAERLTLQDKVLRLQRLIELNPRVNHNSLHVSVDFHPRDAPSREQFITIAKEYMEKIGFGRQPYLVYDHRDTTVPHIHILSANIQADGRLIKLYENLMRDPIPITRQLEEKYHLTKARKREKQTQFNPNAMPPQRLEYGKVETREGLRSALEYLLPRYNYTSLAELNALLRQYNIQAYNGKPGGFMHSHGGLLYQFIDEKGKSMDRGIKASDIAFGPGLRFLEQQFKDNRNKETAAVRDLATRIELTLRRSPAGLSQFIETLRQAGIQTVTYSSHQGQIYGMVFIDHRSKLAVSDQRLGPGLNVDAILVKLGHRQEKERFPDPTLTLETADQRRLLRDMHRSNTLLKDTPAQIEQQKQQTRDNERSR